MLARVSVQCRSAPRLWRRVRSWVRSDATHFGADRNRGYDRRLAEWEEPPLGAHLVTPRIGFVHHGIYVGEGRVMHCGGVSGLLPRGPVEEVSLQFFRRGRPVAVRGGALPRFSAQEVIERARSRLGENGYRLLTNNCEHFCEWCLRGRHRSYQVERLIRWMRPLGASSAGDSGVLGWRRDPSAAAPSPQEPLELDILPALKGGDPYRATRTF